MYISRMCIRFKIPYNNVQTGFNRPAYRGFILYSKVNRWNASENDLELERLPIYDKSHRIGTSVILYVFGFVPAAQDPGI